MPTFAVYRYEADNKGHEDLYGPIRYVEANSKEEMEEVFPKGLMTGFMLKEIEIETLSWIKIEKQIEETFNV